LLVWDAPSTHRSSVYSEKRKKDHKERLKAFKTGAKLEALTTKSSA